MALDNDVAKVNADAKLKSRGFGTLGFVLSHAHLPNHCASGGVYDRRELNQHTVAHKLDDAAMVSGYEGLQDFLAKMSEACKRPNFVLSHEARIAYNVGSEDGRKAALHRSFNHALVALS